MAPLVDAFCAAVFVLALCGGVPVRFCDTLSFLSVVLVLLDGALCYAVAFEPPTSTRPLWRAGRVHPGGCGSSCSFSSPGDLLLVCSAAAFLYGAMGIALL